MNATNRPPGKPFFSNVHRVSRSEPRFTQQERALLKVLMHRICEFRMTFGRLPEETEPLLFVEGLTAPVPAPPAAAVEQLQATARACGVDFELVRDFLELWGM